MLSPVRSELRGRPVSAARLQGVPRGHSRFPRAGGRRGTPSSVIHPTNHSESFKIIFHCHEYEAKIFFVCLNKCQQHCSQRPFFTPTFLTYLSTFGLAPPQSFECLRALTNLLIVAPEGLTSCAQKDPRLAKMRPAELHDFVRLRADFRDEFITRYLS